MADLQVGMWLDNVGMARQAAAALVEQDPDAVLLLGDYVYGDSDVEQNVRVVVEVLRVLPEAGIPTVAVLGNHDHTAGAASLLTDRLESVGIEVLVNEATAVELGGQDLHLVGVGSSRARRVDVAAAFDDVPADAARVVVMHNPDAFDRLPARTAPLGVAGHTHGGQIRVPFRPDWSLLRFVQDHPVHSDGWIPDYGAPGNELFVNRGIGMSVAPVAPQLHTGRSPSSPSVRHAEPGNVRPPLTNFCGANGP